MSACPQLRVPAQGQERAHQGGVRAAGHALRRHGRHLRPRLHPGGGRASQYKKNDKKNSYSVHAVRKS